MSLLLIAKYTLSWFFPVFHVILIYILRSSMASLLYYLIVNTSWYFSFTCITSSPFLNTNKYQMKGRESFSYKNGHFLSQAWLFFWFLFWFASASFGTLPLPSASGSPFFPKEAEPLSLFLWIRSWVQWHADLPAVRCTMMDANPQGKTQVLNVQKTGGHSVLN